jgi:hypothetical protein
MKRSHAVVALGLGLSVPAAAASPPAAFPVRESLSCAEMRKNPTAAFSRDLDLGSGSYSPTDIVFGCAGGLGTLPETRHLVRLGEAIRGRPLCGGTLSIALGRYYDFELLKAGLAPELFLRQSEEAGKQQDPGPGARVPEAVKLAYFETWSLESRSNFRRHAAFLAESGRALPRLVEHYRRHFRFPETEAQAVARYALQRIADRAFGVFPSGKPLEAPPALVRLSMDPASGAADLRRALSAAPPPGPEEIDRALKAALLHGKPRPYLSLLIERLDTLEWGDEPAIFFALGNRDDVEYLLERGAAVDAANGFGKTPLFYAIELRDLRLVELLLDRGADVNHAYKSAAELAPAGGPLDGSCGPYGGLRSYRRTPLMHAAQRGDLPMLALLVRRGARLADLDESGADAADYAVAARRPASVAYLESRGLRPHRDRWPACLAAAGS